MSRRPTTSLRSILFGSAAQWVLRIILTAVFAVAVVPKIVDPSEFARSVFRYQMLPHQLVNLAAIYLPWIELSALPALYLPGRYRQAAVLVFLGLLAIFTVAIGFNLWRGLDIACGCFSVDSSSGLIGFSSVLRNLFLIFLCCWLFVAQSLGERGN